MVTDLKLAARDVPIDADLLAALPDDRRAWLQKVGISGRVDITGTSRRANGTTPPGVTTRPVAGAKPPSHDTLDYDLNLAIHDGTLWPAGGTFAVSDVAGKMRLDRNTLEVFELKGRRARPT